ncbi:hypothetical protein ACFSUD_02385 [Sulfitobacter aestuarii]|uniref:DUF2244 domain-containing protein n=1 Tax=Sulfitobacter aestuarii TaxID=2161676 RepID=A0ABW5TXP9_9RHOB
MRSGEDDEVLARLTASKGRRFIGFAALVLLGAMILYLALTGTVGAGWRMVLLAFGLAALWAGERMRRATASGVELTAHVLRDADGTLIARIEEIVRLDRGAFAFKPSNGFLLRTRQPAPRRWRPGLWWRVGRRIGIGGMTPGDQTKVMAELIAEMLARR